MTLFLAGPTGSGKSAAAVELAEMLDAEIVSSDAYQVYREMPILTAAPSPADRERVPHHMVSIIPVQRNWNATEHYHRAMRCMEKIRARGKIAIVTGGSGLYFKFLSHGLSEAPPGDVALRASFADCSTEALYARLSSLDPEGAASTDAANRRYVERNLEIVLAGGKPLSFWKRNWLAPPRGPGWVISRDVSELDGRIARRAARMMQEGAVEEAASLGPCSATAERTLGLALIRSMLRGKFPMKLPDPAGTRHPAIRQTAAHLAETRTMAPATSGFPFRLSPGSCRTHHGRTGALIPLHTAVNIQVRHFSEKGSFPAIFRT